MPNTKTISIGIPALNEEQNIVSLLKQLSNQNLTNAVIDSVIVVSDGSTDKTVPMVKEYMHTSHKLKVNLIEGNKRLGKAARQNQIIENTNSDILVLLDADIRLKNNNVLEKLITPLLNHKADFSGALIKHLPPENFFEKTLGLSMDLKKLLFDAFMQGNNVYNCHGPCRAFNKKAYSLLDFKQNSGEDMFSYLVCVEKGLKFMYVKKAEVYYRLPSNLSDHVKQSLRFSYAEKNYKKAFSNELIKREFSIPIKDIIRATAQSFPLVAKRPHYIVTYGGVLLLTKVVGYLGIKQKETWKIASSKFLESKC